MKKKVKVGLTESINILQSRLQWDDEVDVALLALAVHCIVGMRNKKNRKQACRILSRIDKVKKWPKK